MAITFDGPNLRIILDAVSALDIEDLYSRWKDFSKTGNNSRFPFAFADSFGGNTLQVGLDAGAYFTLRNDLGWRIRPDEANRTVSVTGNLVAFDSTLPLTVPTTGAFTVLLNGLQPITQNIDGQATLIWQRVLEGTLTMEQAQRIMLSVLAGKSTATQTPFRFRTRDLADGKDRVDALHSEDGDRTSVTLDGT